MNGHQGRKQVLNERYKGRTQSSMILVVGGEEDKRNKRGRKGRGVRGIGESSPPGAGDTEMRGRMSEQVKRVEFLSTPPQRKTKARPASKHL